MADQENKIFRKTEIVGTSIVGFDDGVQKAIERARKTLRKVTWFEIKEQRGRIMSNGSIEYQITLEIGFQLEEPDH